jgi:anti-anti-sigma regulatory factor
MNQNETTGQTFQFFLAQRNTVAIVSLVGPLTAAAAGDLDKCAEALREAGARWVVLNFRDVPPTQDRTALRALAQLQKQAREAAAGLFLTGVHPKLRAFLQDRGVIRPHELLDSVRDAIEAILKAGGAQTAA